MGVSDSYSFHLVGRSPIPISTCEEEQKYPNPPKSNLYSLLVFKSRSDSNFDFGHKPDTSGDVAIPIPIPIYSDSNSCHKPNAPRKKSN